MRFLKKLRNFMEKSMTNLTYLDYLKNNRE